MAFDLGDSPLLELRLFGEPSIVVEGLDITASLPKKAILLIAMLALRNGKAIDRPRLSGLLWPDVSEAAQLHNLRQLLAGIRRALGNAREVIHAPTPRSLSFKTAPDIHVDVHEFDRLCTSNVVEDMERALALCQEPLLGAFDEPFALEARDLRQQEFLATAQRLADEHVRAKDHSSAIRVLRRMLAEDPYREPACRALMNALSATGQEPAALQLYQDFRARLRRDLHIDASAETKELYRSIRKNAADGAPIPSRKRSIPTPLGDLIGREKAIADVIGLLHVCRMVTLTGPGGVGKTRLSLAVAEGLADKYLDGAFFVDLAPIQDKENVPQAIASALNLPEATGKSWIEVVTEYLVSRELLLVLDNCEHLAKPAGGMVEELLLHAGALRVLATSRESLAVRGESSWTVPVLQTPAKADKLEEIGKTEAVQLFVSRSRRTIDERKEKDMAAVASICRRLDGLPLAIELAAARTNMFSPHEIERRLDDRFGLLSTGAQSPLRHQTLLECMEWSWELLATEEKHLLQILSVFRGGGSLEAIGAVVGEGIDNVVELLGSLIDKSLVVASEDGEQTRYTLLETVREFADRKLRESVAWPATYDRHREYFLAWVEDGYRPMNSVEEAEKFASYELEHDNLRASIAWCHRRDERAKAIRMCTALSRFWDTSGHLNEGRLQLEFALSQDAPDLSDQTRARALVHVGWMATVQGDCVAAIQHYQEARLIAERRGDQAAVSVTCNCAANAYIILGDFEAAHASLVEALSISRTANPSGLAMILCNLGEVAIHRGEDDLALAYLQQGLAERGGLSMESATISGGVLRLTSFIRFRKQDYAESRDLAMQSIPFFNKALVLYEIPFALLTLALAETGLGNWKRTLILFGACDQVLSSEKRTAPEYLATARESALRKASSHLTAPEIESSLKRGNQMSLSDAIEFAIGKEC